MINARLQREAGRRHGVTVARAEALAIDELAAVGQPLRLHVSGDCRDTMSARILARAAKHWRERGGGPVWTYTHSWREIDREDWGAHISVLASCENDQDVLDARRRGYAPALVVAEHPEDGRAFYAKTGMRWVPCPEQTRGIQCYRCRLCFDERRMFDAGVGITFAAHGSGRKRALRVIG